MTKMNEFEAGQVWKYHTREGEEDSRLYIVQINEDPRQGKVYHIYIDGLKISNSEFTGGIQNRISHSAVTQSALEQSVTELDYCTDKLPDISVGYQLWVDAIKSGESAIFTIHARQLIQLIEDATRF